MRTIYPMMPKAVGVDPEPTMGPMATLFCLAVVLLLVAAGTIGQIEDDAPDLSCIADVIVIPSEEQQSKHCIVCDGSHVISEDVGIPCGA